MAISGILVVVPKNRLSRVISSLKTVPGVSVHHTDPRTGRIVATLEADTTSAEIDGLQQIKALPDVLLAELVYHYLEQDTGEGRIESKEGE